MGAVTPVTTTTTAGYVNPKLGMYGIGPNVKHYSSSVAQTTTNNLKSDVQDSIHNRNGLAEDIFFFSTVDSGDTWTSGIPNIRQCFWCGCDGTDDVGNAVCTNRATGVITFVMTNAASEGWVLVKHGT